MPARLSNTFAAKVWKTSILLYFVEKIVPRLISVFIRHVFGLRADEVLLVTADQITEGSAKDNDLAAFSKGSVMPSESNSSSVKML